MNVVIEVIKHAKPPYRPHQDALYQLHANLDNDINMSATGIYAIPVGFKIKIPDGFKVKFYLDLI